MSKRGVVIKKVKQVRPLTSRQIDQAINKVSGSSNYMKDMEKVFGNINTIDKDYYKHQIKVVRTKYEEVMNLIKENKHEFLTNMQEQYIKLNLSQIYIRKQNKKTKKITEKLSITPKNIIDSPWFKSIRELEINTANLRKQFKINSCEISDETKQIIDEDYNSVNTFKFFNHRITDLCKESETLYHSIIYLTNKTINEIIDILFDPMYDYKKYIQTHWLPQIDTVLSSRDETKGLTTEDTQKYVGLFAKAKYRLGLTDSSAEFTKIFLETLGESDIANLDASRFMNIIEGIDVSSIDKTGKLQMTLEITKENIKKANQNEFNFEDIIKDFDRIINLGNEEEQENQDEKKEEIIEDIF